MIQKSVTQCKIKKRKQKRQWKNNELANLFSCSVHFVIVLHSQKEQLRRRIVNPHLTSRTEAERFTNFAAAFSSSVGALKFVWRSALDFRVLSFGPPGLLELVSLNLFISVLFSSSEYESFDDQKPNQLCQKDFLSLCSSSLSFWSVEIFLCSCSMFLANFVGSNEGMLEM